MGRAVQLYQQACDKDSGWGCHNLANQYHDGHGVPLDMTRAAALYTKSCDLGNEEGCNKLGVMYERGVGMPADMQKALPLYKKAAGGDSPWGCTNLARLTDQGKAGPKDAALAATLYGKGCEGGITDACLGYATHLQAGDGTKRDAVAAVAAFQKACDGNEPEGCYRAALILREGNGIVRNDARANTLMHKACDQHYGDACTKLVPSVQAAGPTAAVAQSEHPKQSEDKTISSINFLAELGPGYPLLVGKTKGNSQFKGTLLSTLRIGFGGIPLRGGKWGGSFVYDMIYVNPASNVVQDSSTSVTFFTNLITLSVWHRFGERLQMEMGGSLGGTNLFFKGGEGGEGRIAVGLLRLGALIPFYLGEKVAWYVHPSYEVFPQPTKNLGTFWMNDFMLAVGFGL